MELLQSNRKENFSVRQLDKLLVLRLHVSSSHLSVANQLTQNTLAQKEHTYRAGNNKPDL